MRNAPNVSQRRSHGANGPAANSERLETPLRCDASGLIQCIFSAIEGSGRVLESSGVAGMRSAGTTFVVVG